MTDAILVTDPEAELLRLEPCYGDSSPPGSPGASSWTDAPPRMTCSGSQMSAGAWRNASSYSPAYELPDLPVLLTVVDGNNVHRDTAM